MKLFLVYAIATLYGSTNASVVTQISCDFESSTREGICGFLSDEISQIRIVDGDLRNTSTLDGPDRGVENSGNYKT